MRFTTLKIRHLLKAIIGHPILKGMIGEPITKLRFIKKDGAGFIEIDLSEMYNVEIYF